VLHVVGRFTWDEVQAVADKTNIKFYPRVRGRLERLVSEFDSVSYWSFWRSEREEMKRVGWLRQTLNTVPAAWSLDPNPTSTPPQKQVTSEAEKEQTRHISFQDIRNLQAQMPVHVCTSEREGVCARVCLSAK